MITNKLNIGDYIFQANGCLARITKVNKNTYSYTLLCGNVFGNHSVPFNGKKQTTWGDGEDWFECTDAQGKALELAYKKYFIAENTQYAIDEAKELIGKAKYFLNQINDIEEIPVDEHDPNDDWDNDWDE